MLKEFKEFALSGFCASTIPLKAVRCPNCTLQLEGAAPAGTP